MAYVNYKFDSFKMLKVFVKQMNQLEKDADGTQGNRQWYINGEVVKTKIVQEGLIMWVRQVTWEWV